MQQQQQFNNNNNNFNSGYGGQLQQASQQYRAQQPYFNTKQNQQSLSSNTRYILSDTPKTSFNKKLVLLLFNRGELEKNRMFRADQLASELVNNHHIYKSKA